MRRSLRIAVSVALISATFVCLGFTDDGDRKTESLDAFLERSGTTKGGPTCVDHFLPRNVTVTGTLTTTDCALDDGTFIDFWVFDGFAGEEITVEMESVAFDTFLFLLDPIPAVVAVDDDGGDGTNSRIVFTLEMDGEWVVAANNFFALEGDPGDYTLRLSTEGSDYSRPAVGSGAGRDGTYWRDVLEICNRSEQDRNLRVDFTGRGTADGSDEATNLTIGGRRCSTVEDPVATWFGESMYGALLIDVAGPAEDVTIAGYYRGERVHSQVSGTFDARPIEEAVRDDALILAPLDEAVRLATGFQAVEEATRFTISLENPIGTVHWQSGEPDRLWSSGGNDLLGGIEEVAPAASAAAVRYRVDSGALMPYLSVADEVSGDTTIHLPVKASTYFVVPVIGRTEGHGNVDWHGDLTLGNPGEDACTVNLAAHFDQRLHGELTLGPGEIRRISDLLGEIDWRLGDGSIAVVDEGLGPLAVSSDREILADSRFFGLDLVTGDFMVQRMPVLDRPNISLGGTHLFVGIRNEGVLDTDRARLGFANLTKQEAVLDLRIVGQDGVPVAWLTYRVAAGSLGLWRLPTGATQPGETYTLELTASQPGYAFVSQIRDGIDVRTIFPD